MQQQKNSFEAERQINKQRTNYELSDSSKITNMGICL